LLSQTCVAVPADEESKAGTVTYTCRLSATKVGTGDRVESTISAVVKIAWDSEEERRVVTMESFVCPLLDGLQHILDWAGFLISFAILKRFLSIICTIITTVTLRGAIG